MLFFPQLVILHQAVSVITSLESQVRGELLTFVLLCVYERVIIVMMMTVFYGLQFFVLFFLFFFLYLVCQKLFVFFVSFFLS